MSAFFSRYSFDQILYIPFNFYYLSDIHLKSLYFRNFTVFFPTDFRFMNQMILTITRS